jgi:hypothetical protein
MRTPAKFSSATFLLLLMLATTGCQRNYSGSWKGTTSQGKEFSFTVKDAKVQTLAIAYHLDCKTGGFCPTESSTSGDVDSSTLEGDGFTAKLGLAVITGKFDSEVSSSGELKAVAPSQAPCDCSADVKWTAKKQ